MSKKPPYKQYSELAGEGVTVAWGSPADVSALPSGSFDVVYDNNGKDMAACQPAIDHFKVGLAVHACEPFPAPNLAPKGTLVSNRAVSRALRRSPPASAWQGKVAHYVFVASAGAYKGSKIEPALVEGDPRKDSAGHVGVEKYLEEQAR